MDLSLCQRRFPESRQRPSQWPAARRTKRRTGPDRRRHNFNDCSEETRGAAERLKTPEMVILRNRHMRGDVMISQKTTSYAACSSAREDNLTCKDNLKCVAFNFLKRAGGEDNCRMFKLSDGHDNDNAVDAGYKHQVP
jgi:hypothetical protein